MTLIRYNPWQEINSLQRQLDSLFNDTVVPASLKELGNLTKFPPAELTETKDTLELKLELPGIQVADLEIQVTAKSVSVSGERKSATETEQAAKTRSEFHYGRFGRVIPLPMRIQNTEVNANYKDGILHLTLPKAEAEKNRVVKVNLNEADI